MNNVLSRSSAALRRLRAPGVALTLLLLATAAPLATAQSTAREWNEILLASIRIDFARPTVHARNLYHISAAMWDSWATYDATAQTIFLGESHATEDPDVDVLRDEALSFAAYRLLLNRFATSPGFPVMAPLYDQLMADLGYDKDNTSTVGDSPAAIGNRIAAVIIAYGLTDNSNQANGYANPTYQPQNAPLIVALPNNGNPTLLFPNNWQPLALSFFIDQAGNPIPGGFPPFLSAEWGKVKPFSLGAKDLNVYQKGAVDYWVYHDPGPPPHLGTAGEQDYKDTFEMVLTWSSHLDPADGVMLDASPNGVGQATLPDGVEEYFTDFYDFLEGGDNGIGYTRNPVTLQPYPTQMVPRGDYARCLAEFWADGPTSETPPGHWFTIFNVTTDDPDLEKRIGGVGPVVNDLEWDVKGYMALGGALHDVAVTCWGIKGWYDHVRPVSAIRYMGGLGQSTDLGAANYHPQGLDLIPNFIENVTAEHTAPGGKMEHLAGLEGEVAVRTWKGPPYIVDPALDVAGVDWILAEDWWPYQRPTFVTPPFGGYTSGHSTYSRAGAVIMTAFTGSKYFPGGLGEFVCPQNSYLVFEEGPSVEVKLQWVSYFDASDQCSLSRIWGGIHPPADDIPARKIGEKVGAEAFAKAQQYWNGVWDDLGSGLAGVTGVPLLKACGLLEAHSTGSLSLTNAKGSALAVLAVSLTGTPVPFKGGTLVPTPIDFAHYLATSPAGTLGLSWIWPVDVPSETSLYLQFVVQDVAGPVGVSLSNAVKGTTP